MEPASHVSAQCRSHFGTMECRPGFHGSKVNGREAEFKTASVLYHFFLKKMSHATSEMERSSVAFAKIRRPGPFDGSSQPASLHHSQHNWKDKSRATMGLNGLEGSYQLPFCCGGLPISCQHSIVCHGNMGHFGAPSQSAINPTMMTSLPALLVGPWNGCTSSRLQVPSPCQTAQS